jgi:erythrin-vacuolar iron transport family protein
MSENIPNLSELSDIVGNDKNFVLRIVQPGLAGLMDGSVSTLAPIFATAFATHNSRTVFLIGAASAVGAGISMAFSEGLSDDGQLTGRGNPIFRGIVTGLMTFIGGFLHTLPFLISNVHTALTWAYAVVSFVIATSKPASLSPAFRSSSVEASSSPQECSSANPKLANGAAQRFSTTMPRAISRFTQPSRLRLRENPPEPVK